MGEHGQSGGAPCRFLQQSRLLTQRHSTRWAGHTVGPPLELCGRPQGIVPAAGNVQCSSTISLVYSKERNLSRGTPVYEPKGGIFPQRRLLSLPWGRASLGQGDQALIDVGSFIFDIYSIVKPPLLALGVGCATFSLARSSNLGNQSSRR